MSEDTVKLTFMRRVQLEYNVPYAGAHMRIPSDNVFPPRQLTVLTIPESTYDAPTTDVEILGVFVRATYTRKNDIPTTNSPFIVKDDLTYTFRDSNGKENDFQIYYVSEGSRHIAFFAEQSVKHDEIPPPLV